MHETVPQCNVARQKEASNSSKLSQKIQAQSPRVNSVLQLQHAIGNQAVQRILNPSKEGIEQCSATRKEHRLCYTERCEPLKAHDSDLIQVKHDTNITPQNTARVAQDNSSTRSINHSLPVSESTFFERRFGTDLSDVRVHTDADAALLTQALGTAGVSVGNDVWVHPNHFRPDTASGRELLSHELTHVLQWRNAGSPRALTPVTPAQRATLESEADRLGKTVANGMPARVHGTGAATPLLHPVYISSHGNAGFLRSAHRFFQRWGYQPITTQVDSVQDMVHDLANKTSLGRITIVSHAHPTNINMRLTSGTVPHVTQQALQDLTVPRAGVIAQNAPMPQNVLVPGFVQPAAPTTRTQASYRALIGRDVHTIPAAHVNRLVRVIRADPAAQRALNATGLATEPFVREVLWWMIDHEYVRRGGFHQVVRRPLQRLIEAGYARARETVRDRPRVYGAAHRAPRAIALPWLEREVFRLLAAWAWPAVGNLQAQRRLLNRVRASPSVRLHQISRNPDFLAELSGAPGRVTTGVGRLERIESHWIGRQTRDQVIQALPVNSLNPIGGNANTLARGYVWWAVEHAAPRRIGFTPQRRNQIQAVARQRMTSYQNQITAAFQARHAQPPTAAQFTAIRVAVTRAVNNFNFAPAPGAQRQRQAVRQLRRGGPTAALQRNPTFLRDLEVVRAMVTPTTWFEIQGCRAGHALAYLEAFRNFFANSRYTPHVSAPMWFQSFGNYGIRTVFPRQLPNLWAQPAVRAAFRYWHPILVGGALPAHPGVGDLLALLQRPMAMPLFSPATAHPRRRNLALISLHGQHEGAFISWLRRHAYRLTNPAHIRAALFQSNAFLTNVAFSQIDWLQETRGGGQLRFRTDPDYANRIRHVR